MDETKLEIAPHASAPIKRHIYVIAMIWTIIRRGGSGAEAASALPGHQIRRTAAMVGKVAKGVVVFFALPFFTLVVDMPVVSTAESVFNR